MSPQTKQESGGPGRQPLQIKPRLSGTLMVELEVDEPMPVTQGELAALERLLDGALVEFTTAKTGTPDR